VIEFLQWRLFNNDFQINRLPKAIKLARKNITPIAAQTSINRAISFYGVFYSAGNGQDSKSVICDMETKYMYSYVVPQKLKICFEPSTVNVMTFIGTEYDTAVLLLHPWFVTDQYLSLLFSSHLISSPLFSFLFFSFLLFPSFPFLSSRLVVLGTVDMKLQMIILSLLLSPLRDSPQRTSLLCSYQ
jgi:hypothetical protein